MAMPLALRVLLWAILLLLLPFLFYFALRYWHRRLALGAAVRREGELLVGVATRRGDFVSLSEDLRGYTRLWRATLEFEPFPNCEEYYLHKRWADFCLFCRMRGLRPAAWPGSACRSCRGRQGAGLPTIRAAARDHLLSLCEDGSGRGEGALALLLGLEENESLRCLPRGRRMAGIQRPASLRRGGASLPPRDPVFHDPSPRGRAFSPSPPFLFRKGGCRPRLFRGGGGDGDLFRSHRGRGGGSY